MVLMGAFVVVVVKIRVVVVGALVVVTGGAAVVTFIFRGLVVVCSSLRFDELISGGRYSSVSLTEHLGSLVPCEQSAIIGSVLHLGSFDPG